MSVPDAPRLGIGIIGAGAVTAAKAAMAQSSRLISSGTSSGLLQRTRVERIAKASSTLASAAARFQSARRPPIRLPRVRPTPISSRVQVMPRGETPVTSPSSGAM